MQQNLRLGLFIVLGLGVLAVGILMIGGRQSMWQSTYILKAEFANVGGLNESADVRVGGIREGSVQHIQLPREPRGKVTVVMTLSEATRDVVRKDSTAAIKSQGLLGDEFVDISFGTPDAAKLKGGEVLKSVAPIDFSNVLAKANYILDSAKVAVDNVQDAAGNIAEITSKINQGKGTVGALLNDRTMYTQATESVSAMHDDLEALKSNFLLKGFFNKRGYVDSDELKKHEISALPGGQPLKTFTLGAKQLFGKDTSAKIKDNNALKGVGDYLQNQKFGSVVVVAAAGMKGDSDKMLTLTQAQSTVVRNYLVQNFKLEDARIKTMGLGKSDQLGAEHAVEIRVYGGGK